MAVASIALPFLPMLPTQILLNLLYDLSELGIPFDGVRPEATAGPQVWDLSGLIRFVAIMEPLSSLFDCLTFGGIRVQRLTGGISNNLVSRIDGDADLRHLHHPHQRPTPEGSSAARSRSVIALNADRYNGVALQTRRRLVWLRSAAMAMLVGTGVIVIVDLVSAEPLRLFDTFFRVGSLVFGGGHVVLPLLRAEVVPGWIGNDAFLAGYSAAQAVPGPLFTFAAYLGAVIGGGKTAFLCLLANFLPSFLASRTACHGRRNNGGPVSPDA